MSLPAPLAYDHPLWEEWKFLGRTAYYPALTRLTGNPSAGILLSQIIYWYGPDTKGRTRLRVTKEGRPCLAKSREEWQAETGLTFPRIKGAQDRLVELGIIELRLSLFRGVTLNHVFLNQEVLYQGLVDLRKKQEEQSEV